ncbi:MAG TPA: hypothetical protein VLF71_04640 [Candidatus Saccharimonadales bacterium]|nr:hypothetical protein [Candidatus Saccharimonadales bacterium]
MGKLHIIYVPGLGDGRVAGQQWAANTWRCWGAEAEIVRMGWSDAEPWPAKLQRLLARIDQLAVAGHTVGLVGVSAGASAVVNAFAQRKKQVVGCVLICGAVNNPDAIGEGYRQHDPAFVASAYACEKALRTIGAKDRRRILSRYALADMAVRRPDSRIPGAHNQLVPTVGHAITIAIQITLGAPSFIRFLRQLSPVNVR